MSAFVLDTWALIAWLENQPAADRVDHLLSEGARRQHVLFISVINLGEVLYVSARRRGLTFAEEFVGGLRARLTIVAATEDLALAAARLKARHSISYADCFVIATALLQNAPLVTGDPEIRVVSETEKSLQLEWIGA